MSFNQSSSSGGSSNSTGGESGSSSSSSSNSTMPFTWAILPLVSVFIILMVVICVYIRRKRRHMGADGTWTPRDRMWTAGGHLIYVSRGGWAGMARSRGPWSGVRSTEGLNELGEAPPPYRKENAASADVEMRDLEEGTRPPDYLSPPAPAVLRSSAAQPTVARTAGPVPEATPSEAPTAPSTDAEPSAAVAPSLNSPPSYGREALATRASDPSDRSQEARDQR